MAGRSCAVCFGAYNTGDRKPLLLPYCGHSLCKECCTSVLAAHPQCPMCRRDLGMPVGSLPVNHGLLELLQATHNPLGDMLLGAAAAAGGGAATEDQEVAAASVFMQPHRLRLLGSGALGQGGCGSVWRAMLDGQTEVAVKLFNAVLPSEDEGDTGHCPLLLCFTREVQTLMRASQSCMYTSKFLGVSVKEGKPAIVMKLYKRGDLSRHIPTGGLQLPEALRLGAMLAKALAEVHSCNIIVGDLKPQNVLMTDLGDVVLTDFSISRIATNTLGGAMLSHVQGTFQYMAPEQFDDNALVTPQIDVWAWGCVMVEMVTGKAPWQGLNMAQIIRKVAVLGDSCPVPTNIPADLQQLISSCFERRPFDRPTSAQLAAALAGGVGATPPPAPTMTVTRPQAPPVHTHPAASTSQPAAAGQVTYPPVFMPGADNGAAAPWSGCAYPPIYQLGTLPPAVSAGSGALTGPAGSGALTEPASTGSFGVPFPAVPPSSHASVSDQLPPQVDSSRHDAAAGPCTGVNAGARGWSTWLAGARALGGSFVHRSDTSSTQDQQQLSPPQTQQAQRSGTWWAIMAGSSVPDLIPVLSSSNGWQVEQAARKLRKIALTGSEYAVSIASSEGLLLLLVTLLGRPGAAVQRQAAKLLVCLCQQEATGAAQQLVRLNGAIAAISGLLDSPDAQVQAAAVTLLCCLAEQPASRQQALAHYISNVETLSRLVACLNRGGPDARGAAASIVHALSLQPANHPALLAQEQLLCKLLAALESQPQAAQLHAAQALQQLALSEPQSVASASGCLAQLVQMLNAPDVLLAQQALATLDVLVQGCTANRQATAATPGAISRLFGLCSSNDEALQEGALTVLQHLACDSQAAGVVGASHGCIRQLVALLACGRLGVQDAAAATLVNLTKHESGRAAIASAGVLQTLVALLSDPASQEAAAGILRGLATRDPAGQRVAACVANLQQLMSVLTVASSGQLSSTPSGASSVDGLPSSRGGTAAAPVYVA